MPDTDHTALIARARRHITSHGCETCAGFFTAALESAESRLAEHRQYLARAEEARDNYKSRLATLTRACDAWEHNAKTAEQERDEARSRLAAVTAERDEARQVAREFMLERNHLVTRLAAVTAAIEQLPHDDDCASTPWHGHKTCDCPRGEALAAVAGRVLTEAARAAVDATQEDDR